MVYGLLRRRTQKTRPQNSREAKRGILLERLERRVLLNAVPDVSIEVQDEAFIGETVDFTITFDLSGTESGFGPFIDVILPRNGNDGQAGTDVADGVGTGDVMFDFFGNPLTPVLDEVVDATGTVEHPLLKNADGSPTIVTGLTPGDRFIVLQLPIGSYEPSTIPLEINGTANLDSFADLDVALPIEARGGFQFGCDEFDNPSVDNPNDTLSPFASDTVTPKVVILNKQVNSPESETATGPNFVRSYTIDVDIADGQELTEFEVRDPLSDRIVYRNNVVLGGGNTNGTVTEEPPVNMGPMTGTNLVVEYDTVTGATGGGDVTVSFDFHVPEFDSTGTPILDPDTGDDSITCNGAEVEYNWVPLDPRDNPVVDGTETHVECGDDLLTNKSIAVQKSVAFANGGDVPPAGPSPGDTLEYTVEFQISDYFDFENVLIDDLLDNGLSFDMSFVPTLTITGNNGFPLPPAGFQPSNVTTNVQGAPDFQTEIQFRVSDELIFRGDADGVLNGNDGQTPGTTGTIVYRAVVDDVFRDDTADMDDNLPVIQGDSLSNDVSITGTIEGTTNTESDDSDAPIDLPVGEVDKEVYAINGDTNFISAGVGPGENVTYRIQYELPLTRFQDLIIRDTLPLPIFNANSVMTFDNQVLGINEVPDVGEIAYGPDAAAFFALYSPNEPVLGPGAGNSFVLNFGSFAADTPQTTTIDLLFTVEVIDTPFADGLFLSNIVESTESSTDGTRTIGGDLTLIETQAPVLNLKKGVVSTNANQPPAEFDPNTVGPVDFADPNSSDPPFTGTITSDGLDLAPIDSDLDNVDAGDLVKFAIVIENTGGEDAFNVVVSDTLPVGFELPATDAELNLEVTTGAGAPLTFTAADGTAIGPNQIANNFFVDAGGSGIRINDPADLDPTNEQGSIAGFPDGELTGSNILVVTFDLRVADAVEACSEHIDTGELVSFGGTNSGTVDWTEQTEGDFTDDAIVTIREPEVEKTLEGTEIDDAALNNEFDEVVIGEFVDYKIVVTIPEGETSNLVVTDDFAGGQMAFVDVIGTIDASDGLSRRDGNTVTTDFDITPTIRDNGQFADFDFGDVINDNRNNDVDETITINVRAVVLNVTANQTGDTLINSVDVNYEADGNDKSVRDDSPIVTVLEPNVRVTKSATVNGTPAGSTTGDAGDLVEYTIRIRHRGNSDTDAYDLELNDPLPNTLQNYTIESVTDSAGVLDTGDFNIDANGVLNFAIDGDVTDNTIDFPLGRDIRVVVSGEIVDNINPGDMIMNRAAIEWTSLDGEPGQRSSENVNSVERTGDNADPGQLNDYRNSNKATVLVTPVIYEKAIVDTSEQHTGNDGTNEHVAIGEIVRYRLQTLIPEADVYDNLIVQDILPDGLTFLDDDTATIAFFGNDPTSFTSSVYPNGAFVLDVGQGIDAVDPTFVIPDGLVSADPNDPNDVNFVSGTDAFFFLGDVSNLENDLNEEYIVIEFNALVNNVLSNQEGTDLANRFTGSIDGTPTSQVSDPISVIVDEPDLTVDKVITTAPVDAGDTVVYEITVTNANGANNTTAFDILLTDTLDPDLSLVSATITTPPSQGTSSISNIGNDITATFEQIQKGEAVVIRIEAVVIDTAIAGDMIPNEAEVTYTSLPGERGTAGPPGNTTGSVLPGDMTGDPGQVNGERTGADEDAANALNDYYDQDDVKSTLAVPDVEKFVDPTEYTIGEIISYDVRVTLSEGTTQDLVVADDLPDGLQFVSYQIITDAASSNGLLFADYNGMLGTPSEPSPTPPEDLVLDFGTTVTTADNVTNNNAFLVRIDARVLNVSGNQNGDTLTNTAAVRYTDPSTGGTEEFTDTVDVELIEPELFVDKQITSPSAGSTPQAGDIIEYTVVIDHTMGSTSDAFEVMFRDDAPANTTILSAMVSVEGSVATPLAEIALDGSSIVLSDMTGSGEFDLPLDSKVTVVYQVEILSTVGPGEMIMNQAFIDWSSLNGNNNPGQTEGERDGSDRGQMDPLNDYFNDDKTTITTDEPEIRKFVLESNVNESTDPELFIGEEVTFRIEVTIPQATYPSPFTVVDDLPTTPGVLEYVSATFQSSLSDGDVTFDSLNISNTTDQATFEFINLVNPSDVGDNDNLLVFDVKAIVTNDAINQDGDVLENKATVTYADFFDEDTATVELIEPALNIVKSSNVSEASVGDTVVYTIEVTHEADSNAPAFDLVIDDQLLNNLPVDKLDLVVGSVTAMTSGSGTTTVVEGNGTGDDTINVTLDVLEQGATLTIMFSGTLNDSIDPTGDMVINTTTLKYDSLPGDNGPDSEQRVYNDRDENKITTPQQEVPIEKIVIDTSEPTTGMGQFDPDITDLAIGEVVTYQITIDLPAGDYRRPLIEDEVPEDNGPAFYQVIVDDQLPDFLVLLNGENDIRIDTGSDIVLNSTTVTTSDNTAMDLYDDFFQITFDVNQVSLPATDASIVIEVDALVLNVDGNQATGTPLTNTANVTFESFTDSSSVDVEIVEPELDLVKDIIDQSSPNLDAGDTVTYQVTLEHTAGSTQDALNVQLIDAAPAGTLFTDVQISTTGFTTPPTAEITNGGQELRLNGTAAGEFDMPLGATITLTYELTLQNDVQLGDMLMNDAFVEWSSLSGNVNPGTETGERDGSDARDSGALNNYFDADKETVIVSGSLDIEKTTLNGDEFPIGDTVQYELTVTLSEGTTPDLLVVDDIPNLLTISNVQVNAGPQFTFEMQDIDTSGGMLTVDFGDVVNDGDNNPNNDSFTITYDALIVDDDTVNNPGDSKTNTVEVTSSNELTDMDNETIDIVGPELEIVKSADIMTGSVGDEVTYTLVVQHLAPPSTSPAYDLTISDDLLEGLGLGDKLDLVVGSVSSSTGTVTEGNNLGDTGIEVTVPVLNLGETVEIQFKAILNENISAAGDMVINTAKVNYDSLPGEGGRPDMDEDTAKVTVGPDSPEIEKVVIDSSEPTTGSSQYDPDLTDLAIGEVVTYAITVDLPAGLYNQFPGEGQNPLPVIVDDQLPDFLALLNGENDIRVTPGTSVNLNGFDIVTSDNSGMDGYDDFFQITFDINQVSLPTDDASIVIEVDALVLNVIENQATGTPLTNTANVSFLEFTDSDSVDVELVEPELDLVKDIIDQSSPNLDAGDTVTYQVTLEHTAASTQDALNVQFIDTAPTNTLFTDVQIQTTGFTTPPTAQIVNGGQSLQLNGTSAGEFDMPLGATITLTYELTLQDEVQLGDMLMNDAFVEWSSLTGDIRPGQETGERDGSDARNSSALNNYFDADKETVIVSGSLDIEKATLNGDVFTIGDTVQYELTVTLSEGTTPDLLVVDDIPEELQVSNVQIIAGPQFTFDMQNINFDGDKLTVDFGNAVNAGDNDTTNDSFTITYDALILNDDANQNGQTKTNVATVTSSNELTDNTDKDITLVEPELVVNKTISDETPRLGDTVTYTFVITHTGDSTTGANDLLISDMLPPEVTLDTNSIDVTVPPGSTFSDTSSGNSINIYVDELELGDQIVITFDAMVSEDINDYGKMFVNEVVIDYDNQPGENPEQRPDSTQDDAKATITGPDLKVEKDADVETLLPGQIYNYSLLVTNKPGEFADDATGVTVMDQLPAEVTLVSTNPPFTSFDPSTGIIVWELGDLAVGESVQLNVEVQLDDPAPPVEIIENNVMVTHDNIDPTPPDNKDNEFTPIDESVTPDLTVTKDDGVELAFPGDVITYEIIVTNVGPQTAKGVTVVDTFPDDILTFIDASDGGVYDPNASEVTWFFDELAGNGGQITLTITAQVGVSIDDPTRTEFTNIVEVTDNGELGPDPTPENNIDTDTDRFLGYGTDAFNDFLDDPTFERWRPIRLEPKLIETYMSGTADPGTTLYLEIRTGSGDLLGWRSVTADAGGNYFANFQGVPVDDGTHNSVGHQTFTSENRLGHGGLNFRRYYEPAQQMATYFGELRNVESVFQERAGSVIRAMQLADEQPLQITDLTSLAAYQTRISSFLPGQQ